MPEVLEGRMQPWRVVLTQHPESMPVHAPLFSDEYAQRTIVRGGDVEEILRNVVR